MFGRSELFNNLPHEIFIQQEIMILKDNTRNNSTQENLFNRMCFYVLKCEKDGNNYGDYSNNLRERLSLNNKGKVLTTKNPLPLKIIYFEGCLNQQDATHREKYLKTHHGKLFLGNRIKLYLTE